MKGVFIKGHNAESKLITYFNGSKADAIPFNLLLSAAEVTSLDTPTTILGKCPLVHPHAPSFLLGPGNNDSILKHAI
jgi:hypothetical protein